MKRYVLWAALAAFLLAGPIGCGKQEIEELKAKVVQMEKDLVVANGRVAEKDKEIVDLRAELTRQGAEKAKLQAERDKLKQELTVRKKKKTAVKKRR